MKKILFLLGVIVSMSIASNLPKYESRKLENGLEVVVIPLQNQSNVIQTSIFYKVGSRNEFMGKSGIAHMLEHLNFKSTQNLKAGEFDEIVKKFGGVDNASTGFDYTHYYIKSSTQNLDKSLELFAEVMQNLLLKEEEFLPERDVVAEERRWRTDNSPIGTLYFRFFNTAFIYHPYHWTPIGFMDDILNWKIDDIKAFHKTYYQPQNAIVLVAGDVDANKVFEKVKKYFSKIKNKTTLPQFFSKEPKQDGERRAVIHKDTQVEWLAFGFKIPDFKHKDQVALSALSGLLSNGKSSLLYRELVDKKRLANQIYGYNMDLIDEGIFMFIAAANQGVSAENIREEILKIIEGVKQGNISNEELEKLKINAKAEFLYNLESASGVADLFGSYFARGSIQPLLEYEENFDKLTKEDISAVAKKYLILDQSTSVILKPQKEK
ncbi:insulinase family protein [Helicobacter sp. faydin-H20]|uniref:M16 family metallopeptidase n=1 Tax=Helicobacter anatolicus TaxID=2905874 RepID=UPI001E3E5370|nr:pitrilysin family protein [Helicobacter anatolicus]MCE3037191.1 insulinase family protein [Helicobacter anatolicus]